MLRAARASGPVLRVAGFTILFTTLVACTAAHKLISARHTSCPVRKVEVRELITQPQREDWIAICGTESYACFTRERGRRLIYGCRPLAAPSAPDAGPASASDAGVLVPAFAPDSGLEAGAPDASTP